MTIPTGFNQSDYDTPEQYGGLALPGRAAHSTGAPDGYNLPSKPSPKTDGAANTQAGRRFTDTFFDIHRSTRFPKGRPWTGEREYAANPDKGDQPGFVTSDLAQGEHVVNDAGVNDRAATFRSVWTAPWIPYPKYFRFNYRRKLITFDYQRGLQDEQMAFDRYYEAAALLGAGLNIRVDYGRVPSFQITAKLGYPTRFVPVFRAAMAGDPWLLGHIDEPNVELAHVLGITQHGVVRSFIPDAQPLATPEQVIQAAASSPSDLKALIEQMQAMQQELATLRAEQATKAPKAPKASPKRSHHAQPKQSSTAESHAA